MQTLIWGNNTLKLIDQAKLPHDLEYVTCRSYHDVAYAIKSMKVRGAPAIGAAAAFGVSLAAREFAHLDKQEFLAGLKQAIDTLAATRPTAVNLFWSLKRMEQLLETISHQDNGTISDRLLAEAQAILQEDLEMNRAMGRYGNELIPQKAGILTHCNAGALATAGYGTALGVIRAAREAGKEIRVYADETRPLLQGARLTVWELLQDKIPVTLITDNMAAFVMKQGKIDMVIVGADRIVANGDVANKIGTYGLAIVARYHNIPFYVAAPSSTFDFNLKSGLEIPIEERHEDEVRYAHGHLIAPRDVPVFNPAFDVTPAELVSAIITEKGVIYPPYEINLPRIMLQEG